MSGSLTILVKVVRIGNSLRMTIPKAVARVLDLKEGDSLEVGLKNGMMIVKKADTDRERRTSEPDSTPISEMSDLGELKALRERLQRIEGILSSQQKSRTG